MAAKWVFLPVLGAPVTHAPVLKWDLLPALKRPVDGGRTLRGRPLFGASKTWRGALFMTAGPVLAAVAAHRVPAYRERLPEDVRAAPPALVGALLGVGVFAGELPNSFLKRQLGIAPGAQATGIAGAAVSVYDQVDFAVAALALLRPVWRWTARDAAEILATVAVAHSAVNVVGYAIGVRDSLR